MKKIIKIIDFKKIELYFIILFSLFVMFFLIYFSPNNYIYNNTKEMVLNHKIFEKFENIKCNSFESNLIFEQARCTLKEKTTEKEINIYLQNFSKNMQSISYNKNKINIITKDDANHYNNTVIKKEANSLFDQILEKTKH